MSSAVTVVIYDLLIGGGSTEASVETADKSIPQSGGGDVHPHTKFFQACRGVFEGGGCRGAGHVGAFEEAIRCGVNFSEVAGTSAGSIVAALIGAGATPEFLLEKCAYLRFSDLLTAPKGKIATPWYGRIAGRFLRGNKKLIGKILLEGSAYSSEKIESWVDDRLSELLPEARRPIKFKDLVLPTWVVAADLAGRQPKIWSTQTTPDETVAMAVRCSCTIPLFFEPVESGANLYVDGGMLSNLPSFVFSQRDADPNALGGRILAFRLVENVAPAVERDIGALIKRLVDTSIDGATTLQKGLIENTSTIEIPTGTISGTNFDISRDEVEWLLAAGRKSVHSFITDEHAHLEDATGRDVARYGEDELYDDLVREMMTPGRRIIISCTDTKWFWALFPSVVHWMFAGAAVDILIGAGSIDPRETYRRKMLESLGARIVSAPQIPIAGFVLCRSDDRYNAALILNIGGNDYSPTGAVYVGVEHRPMIASLLASFETWFGSNDPPRPTLNLKAGDPGKLVDLLKRGVNQYANPDVTIELRDVDLNASDPSIELLVGRIRSFKYRQCAHLSSLYNRFKLPFCGPAEIWSGARYVSTVTPPVLEQWGRSLVAVEGNTRTFWLKRNGVPSMTCLVARGVAEPLPGIPVPSKRVLLSTYQLNPKDRIAQFNHKQFRSIEGAVRPEKP